MEGFELVPCHGGFESVVDHPERDCQFSRIGHADERLAPSQGSALIAVSAAAVIADKFGGSHHPCINRMAGRLETEDQERLLIIVDAIDSGLLIVQHAQIRRVKAGLGDGAHRFGSREEVWKAEDSAAPKAGPVL